MAPMHFNAKLQPILIKTQMQASIIITQQQMMIIEQKIFTKIKIILSLMKMKKMLIIKVLRLKQQKMGSMNKYSQKEQSIINLSIMIREKLLRVLAEQASLVIALTTFQKLHITRKVQIKKQGQELRSSLIILMNWTKQSVSVRVHFTKIQV